MALKSISKDLVNFLRVQRTHQMSIFALCSFLTVQEGAMECHQKVLLKLPLLRQIVNLT